MTLQCNTTNPFLEWQIPKYDYELDFSGFDQTGSIEALGGFTAILIMKSGRHLSSELRFLANVEYNNTGIRCSDGYTGEEMNCTTTLTGYGKVIVIKS